MDKLEQKNRGKGEQASSKEDNNNGLITTTSDPLNIGFPFPLPKLKHYQWWLRVTIYSLSLLVGQIAATLLGRLYYDKGGNSKWMATFVQSAGFPILLPLLFYFPEDDPPSQTNTRPCSLSCLASLYFALGVVLTGDNLMYSYGLLYLPVSTYSLLCATQLGFNAVSSFFINSQRFTALVVNSVVLLTISACLLGVNADNEGDSSTRVSRGKYIVGFLCTLGASATYSLYLSLVQLSFEKVIKKETFKAVLDMQVYPSLVATAACVVGLFASGEWRTLGTEMRGYEKGRVSYVMTLAWTALAWQASSLGLLGLIFEVTSLFSNVISTLSLPLIPVFAVVFFHDKMSGVKVIALALSIWGFLSYIYQHYLDDTKASASEATQQNGAEVSSGAIEIC